MAGLVSLGVLCSEAHLAMGAVTVDSEPEMLATYADAMRAAVGQPVCGRDDEGTRSAGLSPPRVTARNHVSWLAGSGRPGLGQDPCTGRGSYGRDRPPGAPLWTLGPACRESVPISRQCIR